MCLISKMEKWYFSGRERRGWLIFQFSWRRETTGLVKLFMRLLSGRNYLVQNYGARLNLRLLVRSNQVQFFLMRTTSLVIERLSSLTMPKWLLLDVLRLLPFLQGHKYP